MLDIPQWKNSNNDPQNTIRECEGQLASVKLKLSNLDEFVEFSVSLSSKLAPVWISSDYRLKQNLQFLIFPEGVEYDTIIILIEPQK
jgi:hypothetical protein